MKKTFRMLTGLRSKLALSILLAAVASMAAVSIILLNTVRSHLFTTALNQAGLLCGSIDRTIQSSRRGGAPVGISSEGNSSLLRILYLYTDVDHVLGLAVLDPQGREMARQGEIFRLPAQGWREFSGRLSYLIQPDPGSSLVVRWKLTGPDPPPHLLVRLSLEGINRIVSIFYLRAVFQLSLSALLVFLFLVAVLHFMVIRPLQRINQGIERIAGGELDFRINLSRRDELGFLAASFNGMADNLQESLGTIERQVSNLRQANRAILDTQAKLITAEKMASLGTLAAGVAHEVGNPLGAVIGYINLLGGGDLSGEEARECLRRAGMDLSRIHQIMLELLNYARPSPEPSAPLDVNKILPELIEALRREGSLENLEISFNLDRDLPHPFGSHHKLEQVFSNLLLNAVWATRPAGRLTITTSSRTDGGGASAIISFADNGRGIAPEDLGRVFDPFFTTRAGEGGTGLGLAISKRIIEEMGGTLDAAGAAGRGAVFTITLPVKV